jgi:hypothetical protein
VRAEGDASLIPNRVPTSGDEYDGEILISHRNFIPRCRNQNVVNCGGRENWLNHQENAVTAGKRLREIKGRYFSAVTE